MSSMQLVRARHRYIRLMADNHRDLNDIAAAEVEGETAAKRAADDLLSLEIELAASGVPRPRSEQAHQRKTARLCGRNSSVPLHAATGTTSTTSTPTATMLGTAQAPNNECGKWSRSWVSNGASS